MKQDEYIEQRLQYQIEWYDNESMENQHAFKRLRKAEIIAAALIPFTSGLAAIFSKATVVFSVLTGLLGVCIAVMSGILSLGQHQEHWIEYRTTCESLKKEKFMFQTGTEPYDGDDAFQLLVQRVETLVSKENTNWAQYMMRPEEEKEDGKG